MTEFPIRTARVQVPNGDLLIDAYLAQPDKAGTFRVGHEEFQSCLQRIVNLEPEQKSHLRISLGGNALGVAGSGQFCQLADDGAVVIPYDWAVKSEEKATSSGVFS